MGDAVLLEYIRAMLGVVTPGSGDPKPVTEVWRKLYHVVSIASHEYARHINTCKDYRCLESSV